MADVTVDGAREFTIQDEVTAICAELGITNSDRIWARLQTWECPLDRDGIRRDVLEAARIEGIETLEGVR